MAKPIVAPKNPDPVATKPDIPSAPLWHMGKVAGLKSDASLKKLQGAIDYLTIKAKKKLAFEKDEKTFLEEVYESISFGGVFKGYPEAAQLINHYVNGNGVDLTIDAEVYSTSVIVQAVQAVMKAQIEQDLTIAKGASSLRSTDARLMKRPEYLKLFGTRSRKADADGYLVDHGVLLAEQNNGRLKNADNRFVLQSVSQRGSEGTNSTTWRVDSFYDFESFESKPDYKTNIHLADKKVLVLPDGLSKYMATIGIATEFKYYAEWSEIWTSTVPTAPPPTSPGKASIKK